MFTIIKRFGPYAAMHWLTSVPEGHQCGRQHGHNYEIEVELQADALDDRGFVVDYGDLKPFDVYAHEVMDHRNINMEFGFVTTAEMLAFHFYWWIRDNTQWPVAAVRVTESPGRTMSEFRERRSDG